jgi:hypothetical protein
MKETNIDKVVQSSSTDHFKMIFWFIVGLTAFGMFLSVFLVMIFPKETAARFGDTALIFWLSTAVSGGIGYLIGSSVQKTNSTPGGTTTAQMSATIQTEPVEKT